MPCQNCVKHKDLVESKQMKCNCKRLEYEKKRVQILKEEKDKMEFDRTKYNVCSYKNCKIIFEKYLTKNKTNGTKCEKHYNLSYNYSKKYEDKIKQLCEENNKILKENQSSCTNCATIFNNFKVANGINSKYCNYCYETTTKNKKIYREENPEKYEEWNKKKNETKGYELSRAKRVERVGIEEFRRKNAEIAKEYRKNNPEKIKEITKRSRSTANSKFNTTKHRCTKTNIDFQLSLEEYSIILDDNCFYCDTDQYLNIDRLDSSIGYHIENCVACCTTCNLMKNTIDIYTFINQCVLICKYNQMYKIEKEYQYRIEDKCNKMNYYDYKCSSKARNLQFELTENEFKKITMEPCYLCGVETSKNRTNGIDRVDNSLGYIWFNCKSCCSLCNYMKKTFNIEFFLQKVKQICENSFNKLDNFKNVEYSGPTVKNFTKTSKDILENINNEKKNESTINILKKYDLEKQKIRYDRELERYTNSLQIKSQDPESSLQIKSQDPESSLQIKSQDPESSLQIPFNHKKCNYRTCKVVFENYKTNNGKFGVKCPRHYEMSQKYNKTYDDKNR